MAKRFYEKALAVDFDSFLNAGRHERTSRRRGYRNGHRSRNLLTTVGTVDIRVPRDREGQYQSGLFEWYQRVDRSLEETVRAMFLCGVSTRKVGDVLEVLCGEPALAGRPVKFQQLSESSIRLLSTLPTVRSTMTFCFCLWMH